MKVGCTVFEKGIVGNRLQFSSFLIENWVKLALYCNGFIKEFIISICKTNAQCKGTFLFILLL